MRAGKCNICELRCTDLWASRAVSPEGSRSGVAVSTTAGKEGVATDAGVVSAARLVRGRRRRSMLGLQYIPTEVGLASIILGPLLAIAAA